MIFMRVLGNCWVISLIVDVLNIFNYVEDGKLVGLLIKYIFFQWEIIYKMDKGCLFIDLVVGVWEMMLL